MKRVGRIFGITAASICALGTVTSCNKTGFKVGLLCLHGQTSTYDNNFINGFQAACYKLGLKEGQDYDIRTDVAEDYNEIYTAAKEWAEDGYSMIFADSFGHQYGLIDVAKEYPDTEFCHATGTTALLNYDPDVKGSKELHNYHNAFASIYEGRYLAGVAAGWKMIEDIDAGKYTNSEAKIGYVGAWPYAEVISGYTSFYLGACSAFDEVIEAKSDSKITKRPTMDVKYTFSWYDYSAEKEAALSLINSGCKLISQHADSMGAPQSCAAAGVPNVCYNISTLSKNPKTYLFGCKIDWEPYFEYIISTTKARYEGKEVPDITTDYVGKLTVNEDNGVKMLDFGTIASDKVKAKVAEAKAALISGERHVFDCNNFTITKHFYGEDDKRNRNPFAKISNDGGKTWLDDCVSVKITNYIANVMDYADDFYAPDTEVVKTDELGRNYVAESDYIQGATSIKDGSLRSAPFFELIIDGITTLN